jgi:hypothetical protein
LEGSKYLDLAEKVISVRGIPLTGPQIIEFADQHEVLPYESYQTIVKTLQARIAEDISKIDLGLVSFELVSANISCDVSLVNRQYLEQFDRHN